jgi:hypothetical protein
MVQHAYGLFVDRECIGVVTFGLPPSPSVARSAVKPESVGLVTELNRLCVDENAPRNASSVLVGGALRRLPRPAIVVSYADTKHGHVGYIYQATNFQYYGTATAHDADYESPLGQVLHSRTLTGKGISNPTQWAKENGWRKQTTEPKHRYLYRCGSSRQRRKLASDILWVEQPFPKGETLRYVADAPINSQVAMF